MVITEKGIFIVAFGQSKESYMACFPVEDTTNLSHRIKPVSFLMFKLKLFTSQSFHSKHEET